MRKKHWLIGLVALLALAMGVGGGTALAQEQEGEGNEPVLGVIARVAAILGLEEQQVQDAFDQAQQEMRDEIFEQRIDERLDALLASGRITQVQADELREWYAARPDSFWLAGAAGRGKESGLNRGRGFDSFGHSGQKGRMGMVQGKDAERFAQHLDLLVAGGRITQEQADHIREQFGAQMQRSHFGDGFDRNKGFSRQRDRSSIFRGGFFYFRGFGPGEEKSVPAMPTTVPAGTPTAPADSTNGN